MIMIAAGTGVVDEWYNIHGAWCHSVVTRTVRSGDIRSVLINVCACAVLTELYHVLVTSSIAIRMSPNLLVLRVTVLD